MANRCYSDRFGNVRCNRSAWNSWVRWVVLAVVVVGFLLLFILCSCITARRRRKAGRTPYYGTGWANRPMPGFNNNNNAQPYYANQQPAPPYSAQMQPQSNQGYYGNGANGANGANQSYYGQQSGVEAPQPTYGNTGGYAPPPGPPPAKDGIIR